MRLFPAIAVAILLLPQSPAFGADLAHGRRLYLDPTLGNGTSGKCCATCHEQGRDLGPDLDQRTDFDVMGIAMKGLTEVVIFCIEVALRGERLEPRSQEMADLAAYLIWLGKEQRDPALPAAACR